MSKRGSPMVSRPDGGSPVSMTSESLSGPGAPPAKRLKDNASGGVGAKGSPGPPGHQEVDPEQLGDVLNAAGVDLREEESLLSTGLVNEPGGLAGARLLHAPKDRDYESMLLSYDKLRSIMGRIAGNSGLKLGIDDGSSLGGLNQDPLSLMSTSCEEWLSSILIEAAAYSRHRRLAMNATNPSEQSSLSRALKQLVHKDKEAEKRHESMKVQLGLADREGDGEDRGSEESMQRAANDTARMMTAAVGRKKRFSWMSDSSTGGNSATSARMSGSRRQGNDPAKFKETREENGIVMRDIIPALERKHMGVKKALIRGYAKLRN